MARVMKEQTEEDKKEIEALETIVEDIRWMLDILSNGVDSEHKILLPQVSRCNEFN